MRVRRTSFKTARHLADAGLLHQHALPDAERVGARYAIAVTPAIAEAINRDDPNDPIARQFIPNIRELDVHPTERADPIDDKLKSPAPGLVHRYPDRVLLKLAHVCPVYCRFCFRREMVGPDLGEALSAHDLAAALDYIRATPAIWEVILTGGDPLVLSPRRIRDVTEALGAIPHVKILRWHTRVPVVAPERITTEMIAALKASHKTVYIGVHTNHARELSPLARTAIARLADAGLPLVSQTVLLKGVNDDVDTLEDLMRTLVALRIKPYYLHHGDLAPGTAHFRTTIAHGQAIVAELRRRLSGLAMPAYVLDIPGAFGKMPLMGATLSQHGSGYTIDDADGRTHVYDDACTAPDVP